MARKKSVSYMSDHEKWVGTIFFVLYLLVFPFILEPTFRLVEHLLGTNISNSLQNTIYYYLVFAATVIIFHNFISRTTQNFFEGSGLGLKTAVMGLIVLYGLNELAYRLIGLVMHNRKNLNDMTISAQFDHAPYTTLIIVMILAPFVEEVLFRGLVFGNLRNKSRLLAYVVSCLLFAFLHVWQFAWVRQDMTYFLLMMQYLVPGLVLAWAYDHSGTLWASILLHSGANALAGWTLWN